jgi:hypothetical protein
MPTAIFATMQLSMKTRFNTLFQKTIVRYLFGSRRGSDSVRSEDMAYPVDRNWRAIRVCTLQRRVAIFDLIQRLLLSSRTLAKRQWVIYRDPRRDPTSKTRLYPFRPIPLISPLPKHRLIQIHSVGTFSEKNS